MPGRRRLFFQSSCLVLVLSSLLLENYLRVRASAWTNPEALLLLSSSIYSWMHSHGIEEEREKLQLQHTHTKKKNSNNHNNKCSWTYLKVACLPPYYYLYLNLTHLAGGRCETSTNLREPRSQVLFTTSPRRLFTFMCTVLLFLSFFVSKKRT